MYRPGSIVNWWPYDSDYPSKVELIEPLGEEDGFYLPYWRVNYAYSPIETDWNVPEEELGAVFFSLEED